MIANDQLKWRAPLALGRGARIERGPDVLPEPRGPLARIGMRAAPRLGHHAHRIERLRAWGEAQFDRHRVARSQSVGRRLLRGKSDRIGAHPPGARRGRPKPERPVLSREHGAEPRRPLHERHQRARHHSAPVRLRHPAEELLCAHVMGPRTDGQRGAQADRDEGTRGHPPLYEAPPANARWADSRVGEPAREPCAATSLGAACGAT